MPPDTFVLVLHGAMSLPRLSQHLVPLQVILSAPDRQETVSFLITAANNGFVWRLLRRIQKAELLTPVSIYQLLRGPRPSAEVLKMAQAAPSQHASTPHQATPTEPANTARQSAPSQPADTFSHAALDAQSVLNSTAAQLSSSNNSPQVTKLVAPSSNTKNAQPASATAGQDLGNKPSMMTEKTPSDLQGSAEQAGSAVDAHADSAINNNQRAVHTLLVLDFDWSMIEENSDTFVVRELGGWDTFQRYSLVLIPINKIIMQICLSQRAALQGMQGSCLMYCKDRKAIVSFGVII